jgi:hypothetical protein
MLERIEIMLVDGYSAVMQVWSYMRISCLFLVSVPTCSSWSFVARGFVLLVNIMEVIIDFEGVNRKICLSLLKKTNQEKSLMAI